MFVLQGFYNKCEHQGSQGDWPASLFFQNPYWKYCKPFAQYIHRISYLNSLGEAAADVGLYHPAEEVAAHTIAGEPDAAAKEIDRQFHQALRLFLKNQIDADMLSSDSMLNATVEHGRLCAGAQKFRVLICPSDILMADNLNKQLASLQEQGGMVLFYPVGARTVPAGFSQDDGCPVDEMLARVLRRFPPSLEIVEGDLDHLYVSHRVIDGQNVFMLASTLLVPRHLKIALRAKGAVMKLSPETGGATPLSFTQKDGSIFVSLPLKADEACWLLTGCKQQMIPPEKQAAQTIPLEDAWEFLPLDKAYNRQWAVDAQKTVVSVPLAICTDVPQYPRTVRYAVTLPSGAVCAEPPEMNGEYCAYLDEKPLLFAAEPLALPADGQVHHLYWDVTAASPSDGLLSDIRVHLRAQKADLGDWRRHGLLWFSAARCTKKPSICTRMTACVFLR